MARAGLLPLVCAGVLLGACGLHAADPSRNKIDSVLAVQAALQQGKAHLLRSDFEAAVQILESQIARIDGNREYLSTLRDAYRGHVKNLRLAGNREAEAEIYARRLAILDPGSAVEFGFTPPTPAETIPPKADERIAAVPPVKSVAPAKPKLDDKTPPSKVRLKGIEEPLPLRNPRASEPESDPFASTNHQRYAEAQALLERAENEFRAERYANAADLYSQANAAVSDILDRDTRERWAYCRVNAVVQRLNSSDPRPAAKELQGLEREVRVAMDMTPKLRDFGNEVLASIASRKGTRNDSDDGAFNRAAPVPDETPAFSVRHSRQQGGWSLAETPNFRILHAGNADFAEQAARKAEQTRAAMQKKWFGKVSETWSPPCEIYLHADAQAYTQATGVPQNSPGHSTMQTEGSKVLSRRIDLHVDDINLLTAVLPHETTHVVLAGRFGPQPVPRWADEGMAVLTEPREKVERHLRNLPRHSQAGELFPVRQLLEMPDYPNPRQVGAFYAQSVSVVDYLSQLKSPEVFAQFLADGLRGGYEPALKKHFNLQGYADLEARWRGHALKDGIASGYGRGD